ncbi:MAG: CAP domain-containing protein [Pseudomonadota bacterium]
MIRAVVCVVMAPFIAGCSLGTQSLSFGFNDDPAPTSANATRSTPLFARDLPEKPAKSRTANSGRRVAALDRSGSKSYANAPKGALADRDYTRTALNIENARSVINAYRKSKGLRPLALSAELTRAAKMHSRDLAKWDRISHYGSDGSNPWDRVKRAGFRARLAAENVGTGQASFPEVMRGWKNSPGHNKNLLLADATHMGIALVNDPKTEFNTFWTLVLGTPM